MYCLFDRGNPSGLTRQQWYLYLSLRHVCWRDVQWQDLYLDLSPEPLCVGFHFGGSLGKFLFSILIRWTIAVVVSRQGIWLLMEACFFGFLRSSALIENVIDIVPQFGVGWLPGINVISQTITDGYVPYPKSVLLTRRLLSLFVPPLRFSSNSRRINIQCWMSWNPISIKR